MTDNEIEKLLKELKELNAHFELQNFEAKKVLDKIENEMKVEFPSGFKMKNIEKEILLETYRPWVKKLGQWHLADDDGKTRCGKPMLGNNYAKYIPENERTECPDCFK